MSALLKASHRGRNSVTAPVEMCSARVGDSLFGLPISHILEIVGSAHPQAVPLAPGFVGGLVHYRGDVLTTVSLRHLLGLAPLDHAQPFLVLEGPGGSFGVLVDAVGEVLTVSPEDYEPNPSTLDESRKKLFTGSYKLKNGLLAILDPTRLDPLYLVEAQAA
ncbi:MAG: chemotaxis protein CheW [Terracidiphilus sp.]